MQIFHAVHSTRRLQRAFFSKKKQLGQVQHNNYQPVLVTFHLHIDTITKNWRDRNSENDVAIVFACQSDDDDVNVRC